ncbi:hypothetical protein CI238_13297 [Colletotrichum incanum]|uniref:Uncharacterized protein n=1 Tax=Colletotrichum incanum TaxID=1573173 RepID=A0A167AKI0_COLIC|nr:hypothetical protein CI238_13297 [Colletotrichum incanum]
MARHKRGAIQLLSGLVSSKRRKQKRPKRQCAACRALYSEVKRLLLKTDDLETDLSVLKEAVAQAPEQQRIEGDSLFNLEDFDGFNLDDFDNGFNWEEYGAEGTIQQEQPTQSFNADHTLLVTNQAISKAYLALGPMEPGHAVNPLVSISFEELQSSR